MLLLFLIPLILFLGIITSYTDIREGKIRNRHLLIALLYFAVAIIVYNLTGFLKESYDYFQLIYIGANLLLALVFGAVLWISGFWTAGDAKLYAIFAMIVSAVLNRPQSLIDFAFVSVLVFAFVPFFLYFMFISFFSIRFADVFSGPEECIFAEQYAEDRTVSFCAAVANTVVSAVFQGSVCCLCHTACRLYPD